MSWFAVSAVEPRYIEMLLLSTFRLDVIRGCYHGFPGKDRHTQLLIARNNVHFALHTQYTPAWYFFTRRHPPSERDITQLRSYLSKLASFVRRYAAGETNWKHRMRNLTGMFVDHKYLWSLCWFTVWISVRGLRMAWPAIKRKSTHRTLLYTFLLAYVTNYCSILLLRTVDSCTHSLGYYTAAECWPWKRILFFLLFVEGPSKNITSS